MDNTLLYSSKELSMLRANKQAQRHLDNACRQIDQEKTYTRNDWDNKIKTFISQKKKIMPKGWDHTKYRPPSAWCSTSRTLNGGLVGEYGAPTLSTSKIPRTWTLRSSYIKYADGRMVPKPLVKTDESNVISIKRPRRIVSAPGSRRPQIISPRPPSTIGPRKSFLVTQLEMEDEFFNPAQDDIFYSSHNESSLSVNNLAAYRQRPLSAANDYQEKNNISLQSPRPLQRPRSSIMLKSAPSPYG